MNNANSKVKELKSESIYQDEQFLNLELNETEINKSEFFKCTFTSCDFIKSKFTTCTFEECKFEKCILNLVKLANTTLNKTPFKNCHMTGIDFSVINNKMGTELDCSGCNLSYSSFVELNFKYSKLINCKLHEVSIEKIDFESSDFSESDFLNARIIKSNLRLCDFRTSVNYFFDINDNRSKGAKFAYPQVLNLLKWFEVEVV
jgi:fluoroquinolone resistance protein